MNATIDRKPKALLLDDDLRVLRMLGTALEARGYEVRAATDGEAGVGLLVDELLDLDVVVADSELPGRDAWSLLHLVRNLGGERDLGIVVLCDGAGAAAREALLALGADAVADRAAGPGAVADVVAEVAGRPAPRAPRWSDAAAARPALRGALLLTRDALRCAPVPALAPAAS